MQSGIELKQVYRDYDNAYHWWILRLCLTLSILCCAFVNAPRILTHKHGHDLFIQCAFPFWALHWYLLWRNFFFNVIFLTLTVLYTTCLTLAKSMQKTKTSSQISVVLADSGWSYCGDSWPVNMNKNDFGISCCIFKDIICTEPCIFLVYYYIL